MLFAKTHGKSLMFPVAMAEVIISADALASPKDVRFVTTLVSNEFSSANTTVASYSKKAESGAELLGYTKDGLLKGTISPSADLDDRCASACYEWIGQLTLISAAHHSVRVA